MISKKLFLPVFIVLNAFISSAQSTPTQINYSICDTELPYLREGKLYTTTGTFTYSDTLVNTTGADSIVIHNLVVIPSAQIYKDTTIFEDELPFEFHGSFLYKTGMYNTVVGTNPFGCDTILNLYLNVIESDYYSLAKGLTGEELKSALHNIIKNHKEFPYTSSSTDTWDILKESDRSTANPENVILFYSGWSVNAAQEYNNNTGCSREHVWAKSHGDFGTDLGAGTDVHHLRPADISVNSARGNDDFDNGGSIYVDGDGTTACRTDNDSWEARDEVKGDVARMLFYMAVRYEGEGDEPDLELVDEVNTFDLNATGKGYHGKLSTLLEWHNEAPVDSFEINRNNVIYRFQENRNPFIDHPEYVEQVWSGLTSTGAIENKQLKIYPNPAKDYLNIELQQNQTA